MSTETRAWHRKGTFRNRGISSYFKRQDWQRLLRELPPIPTQQVDGQTILAPAQFYSQKENMEKPELYSIFPYRGHMLGKDNLEIGRRTFAHREHKGTGGWQQTTVQAAMLGLTDTTSECVSQNGADSQPFED